MVHTRRMKQSRMLAVGIAVFLIAGLMPQYFLLGNASASGGVAPRPPVPALTASSMAAALAVQSAPSAYNKLVQDDSSGDIFRFNSSTGDYLYSRCSNGFVLTGRGTLTIKGSLYTLQHNASDRRVLAKLDEAVRSGSASIQVFSLGTTFTITDRNTTNNPGSGDSTTPQVSVTGANGGEIVDTGSSFTISWEASDNISVTKQDVLLSTDSGATFTTIVQGLPGNVESFDWITPLISTSQRARIRVITYDAACNVSRDDSDADFTLLNNNTSFTHVADTPLYMVGGGFNSIVHLCNTSSSNLTVELAVRNRFGTGLVNLPSKFTLGSDQSRAIDLKTILTPGASPVPGDPNILRGSIRLRHNGGQANDVRAILAVDRNNEDQSFTLPFTYAAAQQSATGTMQCSPMYYFDNQTDALLSIQNVTNAPVTLNAVIYYGTGAAGTPNGQYQVPTFTIPAQGGWLMNLAQYKDRLQGSNWGSVVINAPPRTVVAQTVMMSDPHHLAFSSNFVDPAMCASTTKTISTLKLDYDMNLVSCLMVCNTSAESRGVTVSFKTDNGASIPSQQFTLGPKQQKMVELYSRQLLAPTGGTMAAATVSYNGNAPDVIAGAVSMSAEYHCAIPAQFIEPRANDGRRLVSPFFRFDERTSGILQVSNLSAGTIKAGAMMKFADTTLPMLNTDLIAIPAGGTATLDLQTYFSLVDDGVAATGCLEVIHNGAGGDVTASFAAIGKHNNLSLWVPLEGGPSFAPGDMALFPNNKELQLGDATDVAVMTGGGSGAPIWSVTTPTGNPGTVTPAPPSDQHIFPAVYASPVQTDAVSVTLKADATSSGGSLETGGIIIEAVKVAGFTTEFGGRMRPEGNTGFTITGKKNWPDGSLEVTFRQGSLSVTATNVARDATNTKVLTGTAPANNQFIGECQVVVLQAGKKISKDKTGSAYYAFDRPSPPTSTDVPGYNRRGGQLTITASGGGIKVFMSAGGKREDPRVDIEGRLPFDVQTITDTTIAGRVGRAPNTATACEFEGPGPCKVITLRNPGGRKNDEVPSAAPLYNLIAGPAPFFESRFPELGPSKGGTDLTIRGQDLDWVVAITIDSTPVQFQLVDSTRITARTLPHAIASTAIVLKSVDRQDVAAGSFQYRPTAVTKSKNDRYYVGPGESIQAQNITFNHSCVIPDPVSGVTFEPVSLPNEDFPGIAAPLSAFKISPGVARLNTGQAGCSTGIIYIGTLRATLVNSAAPGDTSLRANWSQGFVTYIF